MASFPCDLCSSRFKGRALYAYAGIISGGEATRSRHRLCPDCAANLRRGAEDRLKLVVDGDYPEPEYCWICKTCTIAPWSAAFFLTLYPSDEREDWYGGVCAECVAKAEDLGLIPT